MNSERHVPRMIGRPVLRSTLLRSLRSNAVATALVLWTIVIAGVGATVLVQQTGTDQPFHSGTVSAASVGASIAQWWVLTIVAGMSVLAPYLAIVTCAAHGERERLDAWRSTLVRPGNVVRGLWQSLLALLLLAVALSLPVAGMALSLGGTSAAQLGTGIAAALLWGATTAALGIAIACRSNGPVRPLLVTAIVILVILGGPVLAHGLRGTNTHGSDPVLAVDPLVATADVAAPRAAPPTLKRSASRAPLAHLRDTVEPHSGRIPPWGWTIVGAGALIVVSLFTARVRIARPAPDRRVRSEPQ